jgi:hypothetical protein
MKPAWTVAKRTIIGVVTAAALCLPVNPAVAGEVTGNGKVITVNGKSECAYSGRQDNYAEDEGNFRSMIVQNWGQIPKVMRDFLTAIGVSPGESCNPSK